MRPLIFLIGFFTVLYVVVEWIEGHIQYSIEGYIGGGFYSVGNFFDHNFIPRALFMNAIYGLTLLFGIGLIWIGWTGKRDK